MSTREAYAKNQPIRGNITTGMDRILDKPRCSVYRLAAHNVLTGGGVNVINMDTLDYQSEGMWSAALATHIICITAGTYRFTGTLIWPANATSFRQIYLLKNSVTFVQIIQEPSAALSMSQQITADIPMNAGDYVELGAGQNTGGTLVLPGNAFSLRDISLQACLIST